MNDFHLSDEHKLRSKSSKLNHLFSYNMYGTSKNDTSKTTQSEFDSNSYNPC